MAKAVGLSRKLKLQWMDKTAELVMQGLSENEIHDQLNDYLSYEISSQIVLRKTREILMYIWVRDDELNSKLRNEAIKILQNSSEQSRAVHWCMMLAAYPVFADVSKLMGKMSEFQDELTLSQIKHKLYDEWGERSTLTYSLDKIIATMKEFDAIRASKPGKYQIIKHFVPDNQVVSFMVYTMMLIDRNGYYQLSDICSTSYFYPFEYMVEQEMLLSDLRFSINHFGGELSISLNEK